MDFIPYPCEDGYEDASSGSVFYPVNCFFHILDGWRQWLQTAGFDSWIPSEQFVSLVWPSFSAYRPRYAYLAVLGREKAGSTGYVVTNERAIIFQPNLFGSVAITSFLPQQLSEIRRVQKSDGSGDVILGRRTSIDDQGSRTMTDVGFLGIPDVKGVEQILLSLYRTCQK